MVAAGCELDKNATQGNWQTQVYINAWGERACERIYSHLQYSFIYKQQFHLDRLYITSQLCGWLLNLVNCFT